MKCYKGFNKNLECRGFKYEIGKEYTEKNADICNCGFHACESPLDVFRYYPPNDQSRYCEVELDTNDQIHDDSKRVGKHIRIGAEIGITGLINAHFEYVNKHVKESVKKGDSGAATAGDSGAATAGYRGAATAGNSGAATSRGTSIVGKNGLAVARGNNVRVKGGLGSILVIAEENETNYEISSWKVVVVDGKEIKADTLYKIVDGELVEVEDKYNE